MAPAYQPEELLKVRENVKDSAEVVRKINSEAGIRKNMNEQYYFAQDAMTTPTPPSRFTRYDSLLTSPFGHEDLILRSSSIGSDFRSNMYAKNRSSSIVTNVYESYEEPQNEDLFYHGKNRNRFGRYSKNSPTPSIKRGKAEKLLKEHGSPPGVRVTAGGRIVPDGLSPLNSPGPYYKDPADARSPRISAYPMAMGIAPKLVPGQLFDVGNGVLCQFIDGELRPINFPSGMAPMPLGSVNMAMHPQMNPNAPYGMPMMYPPMAQFIPPAGAPMDKPSVEDEPMPDERTLRIMEDYHLKLQADLKELDRGEVLRRDVLTPAMRNNIVKQRINLVNQLDESRCVLTEVKRRKGILGEGESAENTAVITTAVQSGPTAQFSQDVRSFSFEEYAQPFQADTSFGGPSPLQERSGNVGIGFDRGHDSGSHSIPSFTAQASRENIIISQGVKQQAPRRSHAIEIKKPDEQKKGKSSLNPASPSYEPIHMSSVPPALEELRTDTPGSFMPSPRMIAEMDHLVQSPHQEDRALTDSGGPQPSVSSVSTGDFFPHDTHHHSTTKYDFSNRDVKVNLPAWIPSSKSPTSPVHQGHIARTFTKFLSNDGAENDHSHGQRSPSVQRYDSDLANGRAAPANTPNVLAPECDMDFITQAAFCQISPATQRRQSAHLNDTQGTPKLKMQMSSQSIRVPAPLVLEKASFRAYAQQNASPTKTADYWAGFQAGLQQEFLTEIRGEDHCRGYRDGILQSTNPTMPVHSPASYRALSEQINPSALSESLEKIGAAGKAPTPPMTSLVTSPQHSTSPGQSPSAVKSPGVVASPFTSVSDAEWSAAHRQVGCQTSFVMHGPPSPLANRANVNTGMREVGAGRVPSSALPGPLPNNDAYAQQRFSKATTSASTGQARGWFPQYDGSGEDVLNEVPVNESTPSSPTMRALARSSQPPSPVKRTASAAMAKVQQIAGLNNKKDKSSADVPEAKMSSPEKEKWSAKWRKRFENLKEDEQKEIAKYKKNNPVV